MVALCDHGRRPEWIRHLTGHWQRITFGVSRASARSAACERRLNALVMLLFVEDNCLFLNTLKRNVEVLTRFYRLYQRQ